MQSKSIFDTVAVARRLPHKPLPAFEPALDEKLHDHDSESSPKVDAVHLEATAPSATTLKEA